MTAYDHRVEDYVFMTRIDNDGRFNIEDGRAGEYYVTTQVFWFTPAGYRDLLIPRYYRIRRRITVEAGKTPDVVLSS
jgi:hypothetical protein